MLQGRGRAGVRECCWSRLREEPAARGAAWAVQHVALAGPDTAVPRTVRVTRCHPWLWHEGCPQHCALSSSSITGPWLPATHLWHVPKFDLWDYQQLELLDLIKGTQLSTSVMRSPCASCWTGEVTESWDREEHSHWHDGQQQDKSAEPGQLWILSRCPWATLSQSQSHSQAFSPSSPRAALHLLCPCSIP